MTTALSSDSAKLSISSGSLSAEELRKMNDYWRAANYLSVGQIYLYANPLLREPLKLDHVKRRLLGHWGTTPGLNFIYVHCNRVIKKFDLNMIYICGPGHGGPGMVANTYLEGTYTELYPDIQQNEEGLRRLFKQFSFPGGIPSHAAPETPAMRWCTPTARSSTIPTWSPAASLVTARARRDRSPPVGIPTSF